MSFANWCVERRRCHENSLVSLKRLDERVDRRRHRRAATEAELDAFFDAIRGQPREAVYLAAAFQGLRRGELHRLVKGDVDLAARTLRVRPEVSKNRQEDVLPLHDEVYQGTGGDARPRPPAR